jgi:AcrR family transcriptional regulator
MSNAAKHRGVSLFWGAGGAQACKVEGVDARLRRSYDIDSLTDVALSVFARKGFDGATMDDVARAAGITKAAIYHHVPGKAALLERGLNRALDALFAILAEPQAAGGAPLARLRFIVQRVALTTLRLLPELSVLFRVRGNSPVEVRAIERRREFDGIVADLVADAQRDGTARSDLDPRLAARLIFGMSNSMVEWYRPGGASAGRLAATVEALVFLGLESRGKER